MTSEVKSHNIVLLGAGSVGKSALTIQFTSRIFQSEYDPTVEDNFIQNVVIDGKNCQLSILDTAGEDDLSVMREKYFIIGHAFILVYSIVDRDSVNCIEDLVKHILKIKDKQHFPILIVGNKNDLESERKISQSEGQELASQLGCAFVEATAKTYDSAYNVFATACREIWKNDPAGVSSKPKRKCSLL